MESEQNRQHKWKEEATRPGTITKDETQLRSVNDTALNVLREQKNDPKLSGDGQHLFTTYSKTHNGVTIKENEHRSQELREMIWMFSKARVDERE